MKQTPLFYTPRPPAYGETSAEAFARLRKDGRDMKVKERVRLAITYLQPTTREALYDFFDAPALGIAPMKITTISSAVNALIWDGKVMVIGKASGKHGSDVELLQLGVDERVKRRRGRMLEQPYLDGLAPQRRLDARSVMVGVLIGAGFTLGFTLAGLLTGVALGLLR